MVSLSGFHFPSFRDCTAAGPQEERWLQVGVQGGFHGAPRPWCPWALDGTWELLAVPGSSLASPWIGVKNVNCEQREASWVPSQPLSHKWTKYLINNPLYL